MISTYMRFRVFTKFMTIFLVLSLVVFNGCEKEEDEPQSCSPEGEAGEVLEATLLLSFTPEEIQPYLSMFGAPLGFTLTHSADAYRVFYNTRDKNGEVVPASGVMIIPRGIDTLDLVSVQHGTVVKKDRAGSVNPIYAIDAFLFAMSGYLAVAPDYLGIGNSDGIHPYLHAELTSNTVVDMLRAARNYACDNDLILSDNLFLAGYSEGGYATMATHKLIESDYADEFQLTAVAPMSGPYDLLGSTQTILRRETYDIPAFLAYVVVAYDDIYEWDRLGDFFHAPYASLLPTLFDGNSGIGDINDELPNSLDSLFKSEFTDAFFAGSETEITNALTENTLLDWGPLAPVRLFHGTADSTVSFSNTTAAYESLLNNGGLSVDISPLLGASHTTGFFPAMILAETWFDSIRTAD